MDGMIHTGEDSEEEEDVEEEDAEDKLQQLVGLQSDVMNLIRDQLGDYLN